MNGIITCISKKAVETYGISYTPYSDAELTPCPKCGDEMWLGSMSKAKHEADSTPIMCILCVVRENPGIALNSPKIIPLRND